MAPFWKSDADLARAILNQARTSPEDVSPTEVRELLTASESKAREITALALKEIATEYPEDVRETVSELRLLLDDDNDNTREYTTRVLGKIADEHPEDVRETVSELRPLLDDDNDNTRGNAAYTLGRIAAEYPEDVRETVSELRPLLNADHNKTRVRYAATSALFEIADEYPEDVRKTVSELRPLLDDDNDNIRGNAAAVLGRIAAEYPEDVREIVSELRPLLDADHYQPRRYATSALFEIADEYPEDVRETVPELRPLLDDDNNHIRADVAALLGRIAMEYPEDVRETVPELRSLLDADHDNTRENAAYILGRIAAEYPEDVRETVSELRPLLDAELDSTRFNATIVLCALANEYPENVRETVSDLRPLLDDDNDNIRKNASYALCALAKEYPGDVAPAAKLLSQLLEDDDEQTRSNAIRTLGFVAETSPDVVIPEVTTISKALTDDAIVTDAEAVLTELTATHPDRVREAVDKTAPDRVSTIFEDTTQPAGQTPPQPNADRIQTSHTQDRIPDLSSVSSPPRQDLHYDDFKDAEVIGSGGTAIVKHRILTESQHPDHIAIKEPKRPSETIDTETYQRFIEEAKTWKFVDSVEREQPLWEDSEHIVGVIDIGTDLPWIAMEYMDGGGLDSRLDASPHGLPIAEALWIGECLCRGLKIAHDHGIAHLDLKPANVLFRATGHGRWDVPKIADWGLARRLAEQQGDVEGLSVSYAAPEQVDTDQFGSPDTYTDVYQIGAVLYTMLTGQPPYRGSQTHVMNTVTNGSLPDPPSAHREGIPDALDQAVLTALERRKPGRYTDVSRLEETLYSIRTDDLSVDPSETLPQADTPELSTGSARPENQTQTANQRVKTSHPAKNDREDVNDCRETTGDPHASAQVESDVSDDPVNSIPPRSNTVDTVPKQPHQQTDASVSGQDSGWFHPSSLPEAPPRGIATDLQTVRQQTEADTLSEAIDECQPSTLADVLRTMDAGHSQ